MRLAMSAWLVISSVALPGVQLGVVRNATAVRPAEAALVGTIERFEESARRLTLETSGGRVTFVLAGDAMIRQGSRTLLPRDLAAHRGRSAKVRYTLSQGRRLAHWVMVSSDGATPHSR